MAEIEAVGGAGDRPRLGAVALRRLILEQSRRAGVGHIASALSVADIVSVLFGGVLRGTGTSAPDRDRFVLSKGHAALALYGALHLLGVLSDRDLNTYCAEGSLLGVHPEHWLPGVDFSTGSLGHGLSIGAGVSLGARLRRAPTRAYVLLSDAELNEGSTWEAVMFAAHHRLENLVAVVDDNGQQALGRTADVLDLQPIADKWRAFGWSARVVDGHDEAALRHAFATAPAEGRPAVIVARTVGGKGVSFMERDFRWHYLPLTEAQYASAMAELERAAASTPR
jgi:transketolase